MSAAAHASASADTDLAQIRSMAERLDCFVEEDFITLADATPGTVATWRKRGTGPAYILLGRRYLYPRAAVADYLKTLIREPRKGAPVGDLL